MNCNQSSLVRQKNTTMRLGCQLMDSVLRVFGLDGGMVLLPKDLSIIDLPNLVKRCYHVVVSFTILRQR